MLEVLRKASTPLVALLLVATLFLAYQAGSTANATHEPAMKAAAAGSDLDEIEDGEPILTETMKVSSPEDVIIQVTAECSILTSLMTNNDNPTSRAFGSVRLHVKIDGRNVPVSTDDQLAGTLGKDDDEDDDNEIGEVTFCNRAYSRTVTDQEDDDGQDEESDYIDTRTANAFNWIALDTGKLYDDPANGNNILRVELWADYDTEVNNAHALAEAFVGSRTMVIEPIRVSVHEQVNRDDAGGF